MKHVRKYDKDAAYVTWKSQWNLISDFIFKWLISLEIHAFCNKLQVYYSTWTKQRPKNWEKSKNKRSQEIEDEDLVTDNKNKRKYIN